MFCSNCGVEAADTAVFCTKCGTTICQAPTEAVAPQTPIPAGVKSSAVVAGVGVGAIAGATGAASMHIPIGLLLTKLKASIIAYKLVILGVVALSALSTGVVYFSAPGPGKTVLNFANEVNNHQWDNVAGYISSDSCHYLEKQRDMALASLKLLTSLTGLLKGALPGIIDSALGVMGVSPEKLQKMNGNELFAGLLKVYEKVSIASGSDEIPKFDIEVLSEDINGNRAVVQIMDNSNGEQSEIKLVKEGFYWKIDLVDPNSPVFPLDYLLQNAGLGNGSSGGE